VTVDDALRLALAFVLVLPLAWERERRSRSVGLRTYPLVSACVCGILLLARARAGGPGAQADVFYGVLDGIGFVGSGAIVKSADHARGLSTAVTLWMAGAIGAGAALAGPILAVALAVMAALALATHPGTWRAPAHGRTS
jgi:putative Mg2+ transporter-C (MgtC) family protein